MRTDKHAVGGIEGRHGLLPCTNAHRSCACVFIDKSAGEKDDDGLDITQDDEDQMKEILKQVHSHGQMYGHVCGWAWR